MIVGHVGSSPNEIRNCLMNEFFAADPESCENSADLRFLLGNFGPHAGRYLADYPATWTDEIKRRCDELGPLEGERAKALIRRARENAVLLRKAALPWDEGARWIDNFRTVAKVRPGEFEMGIVPRTGTGSDVVTIDDLELSPTADESIEAVAREYVRVSRTLLLLSPELVLVDPYLNPCKKDRQDVISEMLATAAKGKCRAVTVWARDSNIIGDRQNSWDEVREAVGTILHSACWPEDRKFSLVMVDDATCKSKMHPRYLLSIKGGIRFDQGFQRLPKGRRNDVSPLGKSLHGEVLKTYYEGQHDMKIVRRLDSSN